MLNNYELILLQADCSAFPLLKAAAVALKACGKCPHGNATVAALLKTAVTKYINDPAFIDHCRAILPLPCKLGGFIVR